MYLFYDNSENASIKRKKINITLNVLLPFQPELSLKASSDVNSNLKYMRGRDETVGVH